MRNPFDNEERRAFRDSIRRYVAEAITPHVNDWDEAGAIPWQVHEDLGAMGFFGFGIDEEYGGLGFDDAFMRAAANEELVKCGASGVAAAVGGRMISVAPIFKLGDEAMKRRVLPEVLSGRQASSLAITEPSGGSDVANLKTTARRDGDVFVLNGSKTFITGALVSQYFVVAARTGGPGLGGISLFLVEKDAPGLEVVPLEKKMGWWCSDQASLFFDDCRVPANQLLGEENRGFIAIMDNFNLERLALIAQSVGMMKVLLEQCIDYGQQRETFGQALIQHQAIRHKIAEISARVDAVEALLHQICWQINEGELPVAEICKAKFFATKALEYCASEAMQVWGGAAYLRGNPVERIYREVKVMAIGGGSEEIMRDLAVRQMGL